MYNYFTASTFLHYLFKQCPYPVPVCLVFVHTPHDDPFKHVTDGWVDFYLQALPQEGPQLSYSVLKEVKNIRMKEHF